MDINMDVKTKMAAVGMLKLSIIILSHTHKKVIKTKKQRKSQAIGGNRWEEQYEIQLTTKIWHFVERSQRDISWFSLNYRWGQYELLQDIHDDLY